MKLFLYKLGELVEKINFKSSPRKFSGVFGVQYSVKIEKRNIECRLTNNDLRWKKINPEGIEL